MIGRSALWVARQHDHSIATLLRFYAAWADGALESDVAAIAATVNSGHPLHQQQPIALRRKVARPISRPFEMEFPVSSVPEAQFATGFATQRDKSEAKLLNTSEQIGGRETSSSAARYLILNGYFRRRTKIPSHVPTENRG